MAPTRIEILAAGGFYWPAQQRDYGDSFAVSNNSPLKMSLRAPGSRSYADGYVEDGWLMVLSGSQAHRRFSSANEAIAAVRGISSNAYLFFHFFLNKLWFAAEDLRHEPEHTLSALEERALKLALKNLQQQPDRQRLDEEPELYTLAAQNILSDPDAFRNAQQSLDNDVWLATKFAELGWLEPASRRRPRGLR